MPAQARTVLAGLQAAYAPVARHTLTYVIGKRVQKLVGRVLNDGLAELSQTIVSAKITADRENSVRILQRLI